ncbi:MAG: NrfD/PsrC family molybdoenzyme membrane anchor subunit, partial [Jatrophihabitantaceae bacterium]
MTQHQAQQQAEQRTGSPRKGKRRRDEYQMVPDATFTSYYGRPVVKASPWQADIPGYLFLGGLAAGSSLLAAGADLTGRPALRRAGRLGAFAAINLSFAALVHDLGRPARFLNMVRVAKPTSPMSVGTWLLTGFGPLAGLAGAAELAPLLAEKLPRPLRAPARLVAAAGRPSGLAAAVIGPTIATYTAVLLADTATPTWSGARRELPFVFAGSAAAAAGGFGMLCAPVDQAGPARRLALAGAVADLAAEQAMEQRLGMVAESLHTGTAGRLMRASKALTVTGAAGSVLAGSRIGRRSRALSAVSGLALLAGSACTRFGIF